MSSEIFLIFSPFFPSFLPKRLLKNNLDTDFIFSTLQVSGERASGCLGWSLQPAPPGSLHY